MPVKSIRNAIIFVGIQTRKDSSCVEPVVLNDKTVNFALRKVFSTLLGPPRLRCYSLLQAELSTRKIRGDHHRLVVAPKRERWFIFYLTRTIFRTCVNDASCILTGRASIFIK